MIGGVLLNNAINKVDDFSIARTFWTAAAIMLIAFLSAIYAARVMSTYANVEAI